jgi:putative ABC transport system permease protein
MVACFNYVNINTAISIKRTREVGVKKIYGSDRKTIIWEFILESGVSILVSLILASLFTQYLMPYFSLLLGTQLSYSMLSLPGWLTAYFLLFLLCTLLASFYGAWYISSIRPLSLISVSFSGKRRELSRNILVTLQFIISSSLIICTLIFYAQMRYAGRLDPGFNKHNVVSFSLSETRSQEADFLKEQLKAIPGIVSVTKSAGGTPGFGLTSNGYRVEGSEEIVLANCIYADPDYIKTLGIEIVEGRDFRGDEEGGTSMLINQTFAGLYAWTDPLNKKVTRNGKEYRVVGVMKDFHTSSIYNSIQPLVMPLYNEWGAYRTILIRTSELPLSRIIDQIEVLFTDADPDSPFSYTVLEDSMKSLYSKERYINLLFLALALIGIVVSCLGLFGLTTFSAQARRREVGIRKVNGALVRDITGKFSKELLMWIGLSFLISTPVSYLIMSNWLSSYAFRIDISIMHYLVSAIIVLIIGIIYIVLGLIREVSRSPVELIRTDN